MPPVPKKSRMLPALVAMFKTINRFSFKFFGFACFVFLGPLLGLLLAILQSPF